MAKDDRPGGAPPHEEPSGDENEQRERYRELLEEFRTIIPGVQVLFAFLLTAPFSSRFSELDAVGRNSFMVALVSTALSTLLFLTPTSYHRIAPRSERGERIELAVRMAVAGLVMLAVGITAAVFLVTRFIYGSTEAVVVAGTIAVVAVVLWYLVPLARRIRRYAG